MAVDDDPSPDTAPEPGADEVSASPADRRSTLTGRAPASLTRWVPGISLVRTYHRAWLSHDLVAGLVLTALLVPQGMAYAELAGLPPVTGLYTTVLALLAYALFGPSRILVLGPDSALGPLIAASLLPLIGADGDPPRLSRWPARWPCSWAWCACWPVWPRSAGSPSCCRSRCGSGYLERHRGGRGRRPAAEAVRVQHRRIGPVPRARGVLRRPARRRHRRCLARVGLVSFAVILGFRRWLPQVPGVLVAVVGATLAVRAFDLVAHGVKVVGEVPAGFPTPALPRVSWTSCGRSPLAAVGMAFVTLADTSALSRSLAAKRGDDVDPNQEIAALGAANLAAGLFQGFPVSASASRTRGGRGHRSRDPADRRGRGRGDRADAGRRQRDRGRPPEARPSPPSSSPRRSACSTWPRCAGSGRSAGPSSCSPGRAARRGARRRAPGHRHRHRPVHGRLRCAAPGTPTTPCSVACRTAAATTTSTATRDAVQIPGLVIYRFDAPLFFANADVFAESVRPPSPSAPSRSPGSSCRRRADHRHRHDRRRRADRPARRPRARRASTWPSPSSRAR